MSKVFVEVVEVVEKVEQMGEQRYGSTGVISRKNWGGWEAVAGDTPKKRRGKINLQGSEESIELGAGADGAQRECWVSECAWCGVWVERCRVYQLVIGYSRRGFSRVRGVCDAKRVKLEPYDGSQSRTGVVVNALAVSEV